MTKPTREKDISLPSASDGGVDRITTNTLDSLRTSNEYIARAQQFANARVYQTLQKYHSNRAAASYSSGNAPGVDCSQWKLAKGGGRHHPISCYKRIATANFGGLRRSHRNKQTQQAMRMTMNAKNTASISVSGQTELLAIGLLPGTLEDVLHGTVNITSEAMQIESAHAQCDLLDSRVLAPLVIPTTKAPFHSLTLKWALRHHELLSRHRDYVYMDATGVLQDPQDNGARVGYHLVNSVTLPSAPELAPEMQIVRGHMSYCYLYRQQSETQVELFFYGGILPRGGATDRMAFALTAGAVLASSSIVECAMMKKLAFSLRTREIEALRLPSPPLHYPKNDVGSTHKRKTTFGSSIFRTLPTTFDGSRSTMARGGVGGVSSCRVCYRPARTYFNGKVNCCEMCKEPMCNRCKVDKKVYVIEDGVFHPQKMDFCSECIMATNRLNAGWVASQELVGAANLVCLSEKSSSSSEEIGRKSHDSLGSSGWNGGMSRIEESRATMSSDGSMGHCARQSVVWLPTDHLHLHTHSTTPIGPVDTEVEADRTNDADQDPENKGSGWVENDSFVDMDAFVTSLDGDDGDTIPMIDFPSEDEEDGLESERKLSHCAVDLVHAAKHL